MTTYNEILDSEIDPESPITTSLMFRLRDNLLAVIQADPSAPTISPSAFDPGGSAIDGALTDASTLTKPGFYDALSLVITNPVTWPWATIMRVNGNATIDDVLTMDYYDSAPVSRKLLEALLGCEAAQGAGNGGGGTHGDGGGASGANGIGLGLGNLSRPWALRRPAVGAPATGGTAYGGGCLIILVDGNLLMTSGTIKANGGHNSGAFVNHDGGGGGCIIVVCTGTITNGTYEAKGGDGGGGFANQGGGGGTVILVATAFAGSRTLTVDGGSGVGGFGGVDGAVGYAEEVTLTKAQILALCNLL